MLLVVGRTLVVTHSQLRVTLRAISPIPSSPKGGEALTEFHEVLILVRRVKIGRAISHKAAECPVHFLLRVTILSTTWPHRAWDG
jgi:hypothetical protein